MSGFLYENLAAGLGQQIKEGLYAPGDKLPPVRRFAETQGVSVATAVSAYYRLEAMGYIEARPKSGFYVKRLYRGEVDTPSQSQPDSVPSAVTGQEMALNLVKSTNNPNMVQFGAAVPAPSFLPTQMIAEAVRKVARQDSEILNDYLFPPGLPELRQQIARRMVGNGCNISSDQIIVTDGCQEALRLALRACAEPGDVIAIESPTFYGLLQVIHSLRMKVIEIPTDPDTGLSLEALQMAIDQWPIKACVLVPSFSNPLGLSMPDDKKRRLIQMLSKREIPIIEDDVYGEISHDNRRPKPLKAFDSDDWVIYCSSFSKTLSPGLRLGWVASKRYRERLEYFKYVANLATSSVAQLAVAEILQSGKFDRYLSKIRQQYAFAVDRMTAAIVKLFPFGTKVTRPKGGFVLWIELPFAIDTFELANRLARHQISIAPGRIFSMTEKYNHFLRLSCALDWNTDTELALLKIVNEIELMRIDS
ncbi:aminotransferase-like domain-containing protein [Thiomicrorhabdus heinhorstiae]|uniref:PLP-dependent aminotransferase family protein n=1 Tax=Thiomicrorhabdus heinhorstiae TaxID=2748010 RepID=A0ABS0BVI1_9GAMM|nr:PLP-dependent aminotransferase family protein [Thiomicrorhabdus heinhorstiae]MBF6057080.1 PLP-dependent aminotransferase family protein [Thiomicrorhabdus heinhorstiae]